MTHDAVVSVAMNLQMAVGFFSRKGTQRKKTLNTQRTLTILVI
jgi:hypothetical protein